MISRFRTPKTAALTVALAAALSLAACQNTDDTVAEPAESNTTVATETAQTSDTNSDSGSGSGSGVDPSDNQTGAIDRAELNTLMDNVDEAYRKIDGAWPGFRPNEHPVVLGWKDSADNVIGAVAINHPAVDALGTATEIDTDGRSFDSAHLVTEVDDDAAEILQRTQTFEFESTIGGVDSFLMIAGGSDGFFDPTTRDYSSTLLHEMFHRYQDKAFGGDIGNQDVDGYAYTAENLELAALEERALTIAVEAETESDRATAAGHAAAIRLTRRAADDRVVLDDDQERYEGTARYVEHRLGGDDNGYPFHADNYAIEFVADPSKAQGVKGHYGFGRFYGSGAAVIKLLDDLGIDDATAKIQDGDYPMTLLAAALDVTDDNTGDLVEEARRRYDPLGQLPEQAAEAAEQSAAEPSVFDDHGGEETDGADGAVTPGEGEGEGEGEIITDEELACLEERGVSFDEDGSEIPQDAIDACLGPIDG